jgi:4-amino-4-deoxy-L-arabinose transferase-like glycosyltransferase
LLPALFGLLSILLTYVMGREFFGRRVGLIAALLMSLSAFQIYYSQETRYYSLFTLCALLSFFFMLRALKTARPLYFVLYALAGILMYYTHTYAVFVIAGQNLYFVLSWKRVRPLLLPWVLSQAVVGLAILPALRVPADRVVTGNAAVMKWIPDPPLWQPFFDVMGYIVPVYSSSKVALAVVPVLALVALAAVVLVKGRTEWWAGARQTVVEVKQRFPADFDSLSLLGCWLLCPIWLPFVMSKIFGPMYLARYTISAAPAFYILLALTIVAARKLLPAYISLALVGVLVAPGLAEYYARPLKGQWQEAATYIQERSRPGDVLMAGYPDNFVLSWYDRAGGMPRCVTDGSLAVATARDSNVRGEVGKWGTTSPRFWLATSAADEDPYLQFFSSGEVPGLALVDRHEFAGLSTYLFSRSEP